MEQFEEGEVVTGRVSFWDDARRAEELGIEDGSPLLMDTDEYRTGPLALWDDPVHGLRAFIGDYEVDLPTLRPAAEPPMAETS